MIRWGARPTSSCLRNTQCRAARTTLAHGSWSLRTRRDGKIPSWDGRQGGSAARLTLAELVARWLHHLVSFSNLHPSLLPSPPPCSGDPLSNMTISFDSKEQAVAFAIKNGTLGTPSIPPTTQPHLHTMHTLVATKLDHCMPSHCSIEVPLPSCRPILMSLCLPLRLYL